MGQRLVVLSLSIRIAIYAAVWLLVFLPSRVTIAFVSGVVVSYGAARRGYALRRHAWLPGNRSKEARGAGAQKTRGAQEPFEAFVSGYDLYSPSESRWIIGGGNSYPTGDALFDYLHFALAKDGSEPSTHADTGSVMSSRSTRSESGASRAAGDAPGCAGPIASRKNANRL